MTRSDPDTSWPLTKLREITEDVKSWSPVSASEFTYVDISSIDNERCEIVSARRLRGADAPSRARRPIKDGDVIFSNVRTYLRNVAQVRDLPAPAVASTGFTVLRPSSGVDSRYLYHLLRSDFFINLVTPEQTGTHYPATSDRVVRDQSIPLPDLELQRAVADLLDRCDAARHSSAAHISSAQRAVERFRQAALVAACSGRLTNGLLGDGEAKEAPTTAVGEEGLPTLPATWTYERLDALRDPEAPIVYGIVLPGPQVSDGVPYVRQQDVVGGTVLSDALGRTTAAIARRHARSSLCPGDVLLCIIRNLRVAIVPAGLHGANITQGMVRIRPGERVLGAYLAAYLESPYAQRWMRDRYIGLAMPRINVADARAILVPVPPLEEQRRIVERLGTLLRTASELEQRLRVSTERVGSTYQALLRRVLKREVAGEIIVN